MRCPATKPIGSTGAGCALERPEDLPSPASPPAPPPGETSLEASLSADEERLVVMTCALAGREASDLLAQVDSSRVASLQRAAAHFLQLSRATRLAAFARRFSPAATPSAIDRLARRLGAGPPWYVAIVCMSVAPEVRERLLVSAEVREAWRGRHSPHPALLSHGRRLAAFCLVR